MSRQTYNAKELGEVLGISESKAYQFIRQMNAELAQKGFLTVRGKISKAYADKRFFGGLSSIKTDGEDFLSGGTGNECTRKTYVCTAESKGTERTV